MPFFPSWYASPTRVPTDCSSRQGKLPARRWQSFAPWSDGFLGAGLRGESALYFQIVIQAVTLERVPRAVASVERHGTSRSTPQVLEELLPGGHDRGRGVDAGRPEGHRDLLPGAGHGTPDHSRAPTRRGYPRTGHHHEVVRHMKDYRCDRRRRGDGRLEHGRVPVHGGHEGRRVREARQARRVRDVVQAARSTLRCGDRVTAELASRRYPRLVSVPVGSGGSLDRASGKCAGLHRCRDYTDSAMCRSSRTSATAFPDRRREVDAFFRINRRIVDGMTAGGPPKSPRRCRSSTSWLSASAPWRRTPTWSASGFEERLRRSSDESSVGESWARRSWPRCSTTSCT